jgi:two-component system chemotaxis sensor kinase CheA
MLEQFKQKYIEEVNDLLNDLENTVLSLEKHPDSADDINQVFRVMHTIKGTSGMYDFKVVEKITHDVESIYGKIRDSSSSVSGEVSSLTLECVDLIRRLLNNGEDREREAVAVFFARLSALSGGGGETPSSGASFVPEMQQNGAATYYVVFEPEADIQDRGININSILSDIDAAGDGLIIPHNRASAGADGKYGTYWEAVFSTKKSYQDVTEIFLFVGDEVKITKISDRDLLSDADFISELSRLQALEQDYIDLKQLEAFIDKPQEEKKETPAVKEEPKKPELEATLSAEEKIISRAVETADVKTSSIKVASDKLDELMNLVSELVTTKAEMMLLFEKHNIPELGILCEKVDRLSNKFKDNALSIRLVPIESLMLRFQRLVRDLSAELGKEIDFKTDGTDTELDKTIIDNLSVPLMHIIRNSIDHGIEAPEVRIACNKSRRGLIKFTAFYSGNNVFIQIQDDGAGMDGEVLRKKAIEKGILRPSDNPTQKQLYEMIFLPGFSTAEKVTGISGRGVGMDVVKQNIAKLRGEIEITSEKGLGTCVTIKLPFTLSIIDALLVSIENTLLLIPVYLIDSCTQITRKQLARENGRFIYEGEPTTIIDLRKEFEFSGKPPRLENVVVVNYKDDLHAGLIVDRIIGEHQAVLKSLGKYFSNQEYISGGSILGDGSIALVLDVYKLIKQMEKSDK